MEARTGFTLEVSQNEYLSVDDGEMQAVLTVSGHGTGPGSPEPRHAEVILVDCSGSMGVPRTKISAARRATVAALGTLRDGTLFAVVEGTSQARMVYPRTASLVEASPGTRADAAAAVRRLSASGGTSMHTWLAQARRLFAGNPAEIRHAILLTDGRNNPWEEGLLHEEIDRCAGEFSCDPRGIGEDWDPRELKVIAGRLNGRADAVREEAELEADFKSLTRAAMAKVVPSMRLCVRTLPGVRIRFFRQVHPTLVDMAPERAPADDRTTEYDLGAWGEEIREYLICLTVEPDGPDRIIGTSLLLARADLRVAGTADGPPEARGLIMVEWTGDPVESTWVHPKVGLYTDQTEVNKLVDDGYAAYKAGDYTTAAHCWGRALEIAIKVGNEKLRERLERLVSFDEDGVPRLRDDIQDIDSKLANVASSTFSRGPAEERPPPHQDGDAETADRSCSRCDYISPSAAAFCMQCGSRLDGDPGPPEA